MNKISKATRVIGIIFLLIICLLVASSVLIPKPKEKTKAHVPLEMYSNSTSTKISSHPTYSSFRCGYINDTATECPLGYSCVPNPNSNSTSTDVSGVCVTY